MTWSRRDVIKTGTLGAAASALGGALPALAAGAQKRSAAVSRGEIFEAALTGPADGNPFVDVQFGATFQMGDHVVPVPGFYDGGATYRVRFMPPAVGDWSYRTTSNSPKLDGQTGSFTVHESAATNHGPVHVKDKYHFVYSDGTPYRELGTTCYAWTSQPAALEEQTLATLRTAPFNKMRMCVFPKWFNYNHVEPPLYPFEGHAPNQWDFTRPNPAYFQHFEHRVGQLAAMGIEADIILFHPYDEGHWGFDRMGAGERRPLSHVHHRPPRRLPKCLVVARQRVGLLQDQDRS